MKYSFYALMMALSLISCENNDNTIDDPRPVDKSLYLFQFKSYAVKNTVLYKGSNGEKSTPDESYLNNYWSLYQEPAWKKISLDHKNKTIKLFSETSSTDFTYSFTIVNDSVLIKENNNNKPSYIGDFNKNTSSFTLKRTYRYVKKVPRNDQDALLITKSAHFGTTQFENIFGNIFTTPSEMIKAGDQVLWTNIEYSYKE
ncbi:hypothetical protein WH221_09475 [Chryseobacterium culicis]|uniref:Uncharacterized protein n=1 Tax=Chryseobacterium culicis TaxID=680127 RepID=A0A2S9D111_CHRCI|nr:hypothetical protein [Chryseobacterium culicis]PRB86455.1 hypothetical protein CQ022_09455 [Chryseobacterium culicis]PRB92208.1 hypothetical protein CQ033_03125 [Chryseobacterium culicis]